MNRVLLVTNVPTPYRIPLFNELNRLLENNGFEFRVVFAARGYDYRRWEINLSESSFDWVVLGSKPVSFSRRSERTLFTYSGLVKAIRAFRPTLLILPGFSFASTGVCLTTWWWRVPYLIWSGAIQRYGRSTPLWRTWQRRIVARRAAGAVAYGSKAKSYLMDLGLSEQRIFVALNTVDVAYYASARSKGGESQPQRPRKSLLYVGHLTRGKRVDLLVLAVNHLTTKREDFVLRIVGSGPEEVRLRRMVSDFGISKYVTFEGFRPQSEVLGYLADAACLLFPSEYDIWGLVLNEAMAAGVPCLASIHAGATADLISHEETGFAIDFSNHRRVSDLMDWILNNPDEGRAIGERGSSFVMSHATIHDSAAGFLDAILETS